VLPIEFKSSIVALNDDGAVVIALFDGQPAKAVAILICSVEAAESLRAQLASSTQFD
jgi:hypothetical protein